MIEAKVICDSISPDGNRLTTMQLRYPKFIHGEFMTHRVFSRNASSSRAVPTAKLLEEVRSDELRAVPVFWGKNQAGMQDAGELDNIASIGTLVSGASCTALEAAKRAWANAARDAADTAEYLASIGAHKQIVNRIIEPFTHINVVVTATEWDNFFGLRLHKDADPTMQALAVAMWKVYNASVPKLLASGQWHLPYLRAEDDLGYDVRVNSEGAGEFAIDHYIKISVARCARVSYTSYETGKPSTVGEDLVLYNRLLSAQPLHASPAEHQATPDTEGFSTRKGIYEWYQPQEHGNFHGWRQYRKMLKGENCAPLPETFIPF